MQNNNFAVDLDNVHSVLEIGQVCGGDFSINLLCSVCVTLYRPPDFKAILMSYLKKDLDAKQGIA